VHDIAKEAWEVGALDGEEKVRCDVAVSGPWRLGQVDRELGNGAAALRFLGAAPLAGLRV
jgi:hypothetical protein